MLQEIAVREQIRSTKPHEAEMDFFVLVSCCSWIFLAKGGNKHTAKSRLKPTPGAET
jgi:hypothetical protein